MLTHYKALVVVLLLATVVFMAAKPTCLRFTAPEDFARRRMVWYVLTITAFVSPSFWIYALIAAPLVGWAAKRDPTPVALYFMLLFVIPPVDIAIPTIGIKQLFDLGNARLLALVVLLPAVWTRLQAASRGEPLRLGASDVVLLMYGALQLALLVPYESLTNTMRRGFLFGLDTYLVFFAFSRLLPSKRHMVDAIGALWLAGMIAAPMAVFESLRGWLLYTEIADIWGAQNEAAWLFRGDSLRAQVATGHALTLGYILAMAVGCWLYLKTLQRAKSVNVAVLGLLAAGLLVTYSRGPWLTAILVPIIVVALGSRSAANLLKGAFVLAAIALAVSVTPFGADLVDKLPFVGSKDQDTVVYRQQLFETTWRLVQQNPLFGNPFVLLQMEELRQGQGLIDLVNAYIQVALFYGLIGLGLFLGVFAIALREAYAGLKRSRAFDDVEMVWLGASLIACMASTLFFMATAGSAYLQWVFAGLLVNYASLQPAQSPGAAVPPVEPGTLHGSVRVRST